MRATDSRELMSFVIGLAIATAPVAAARARQAAEAENQVPVLALPRDAPQTPPEDAPFPLVRPLVPTLARPVSDTVGRLQIGMGLLAVTISVGAAFALGYGGFSAEFGPLVIGAGGLVLVTPLGTGLTVCNVGKSGQVYEGRCVPTVGGAYIGAVGGTLTGLLLGGLVSCSSDSSSSSSGNPDVRDYGIEQCLVGAAVGGAIGYSIGTLLGAYSGWNIFKHPKPGTLRAALF